jgi:hypothetical protein
MPGFVGPNRLAAHTARRRKLPRQPLTGIAVSLSVATLNRFPILSGHAEAPFHALDRIASRRANRAHLEAPAQLLQAPAAGRKRHTQPLQHKASEPPSARL